MLAEFEQIEAIAICPRCRSKLQVVANANSAILCPNVDCTLSKKPFIKVNGIPVLVDFDKSVLEEGSFASSAGASHVKRDPKRTSVTSRLRQLLFGVNYAARKFAERMIKDLAVKASGRRPRLLVIGGGELGSGTATLYEHDDIDVIGTDIYVSPFVSLVADGHQIPLADGSVDAVWIQAVLEHVIDPSLVVSEIYRVLQPDGLVYADTPFMQQVHEGAFDFTRFTLSGHRWLFRNFELIDAGYVGGPGTALRWSIGYFFRALFKHGKVGELAELPFFWLRLFDTITIRFAADASTATFFYGRRATSSIGPKDIIAFYSEQKKLLARRTKDDLRQSMLFRSLRRRKSIVPHTERHRTV
jgi:SAM-dependent methyltransferase